MRTRHPTGCTPLKGLTGILRIRVGDYRICYTVDQDVLFGVRVSRAHVIGETLERAMSGDPHDAIATAERVRSGVEPGGHVAFAADPLAGWVETRFGVVHDRPARSDVGFPVMTKPAVPAASWSPAVQEALAASPGAGCHRL